jgi:thioesterase domain-containing protein/aryl carrier-like protein
VIRVVSEFPTTPNGKTDVQLLRTITTQGPVDARTFVPARNRLEWQLTEMASELFEGQEIGVTDDLLEAGLDSLHVMQLLTEVEQTTGARISLDQFIETPNVEGLTSAVSCQTHPERWTPLVPLQTRGRKTPFFCVHPIGGNVMCFRTLAQQLKAERPFWGLQAPGVDGICSPETTVEALARQYVRAIRTVQPRGPYMLGGWSFGAIVAYEMACQLRSEGDRVAALVAIDAAIQYSFGVVINMFPNDGVGLWGFLRKPLEEQIAAFRERLGSSQLLPPGANDETARRIFHNCEVHIRAALDYAPPDYDGSLTLFSAQVPCIRPRRTPLQEWKSLCRQVEQVEIPGDHFTMMKPPHIETLAIHLRTCLDRSDHCPVATPGQPYRVEVSETPN